MKSARMVLGVAELRLFLCFMMFMLSLTGYASTSEYELPFPCDESYILTQGVAGSTSHSGKSQFGFDFGMGTGSLVSAVADGWVVDIKEDSNVGGDNEAYANYANYVLIDHRNGYRSLYLHLKKDSVVVSKYQPVKQGDPIAQSGATGYCTNPHLHFQLQQVGSGSWWEQSVPISFADVAGDGIPITGRSYTSGNCSSSIRSPLTRRLEFSTGAGFGWLTSEDFDIGDRDAWTSHVQLRLVAGVDVLSVEAAFHKHLELRPDIIGTTTLSLGFSSMIRDTSVSLLASAWIWPEYLLGWAHIVVRGDYSKWIYWEATYSFPVQPNLSHSLIVSAGVKLKVF